ncbi:hypothetical protein ACFLSY_11055 [Bacteroidota bacterium]
MGLCIKTPLGGTVKFINCSQECVDNNFRFLDPDKPTIIKGSASSETDIDAIYWGGKYEREVWKVRDNARVEITCDENCVITKIRVCYNIVTRICGIKNIKYKPGDKLPKGWPPNNW